MKFHLPTCLLTLCLLTTHQALSGPKEISGIKAVVNGEPITQFDLDQAVQTQMRVYMLRTKGGVSASEASKEAYKIQENALNDLIDRKLILSEFKTSGASIPEKYVDQAVERFTQSRFHGDRDQFIESLRKQGMSLNQFRSVQRDQIAVQAMRGRHGERGGHVGNLTLPLERRKMYDKIKHEYAGNSKVHLRMMSIPKLTLDRDAAQQKQLVNEIRSRVSKGEKFSKLAKEYSHDSFAPKGGFMGEVSQYGQLNPKLSEVAFSLPRWTISQPIDDGPSWRLMYVDKKLSGKVPAYSEIEEEVEKRLSIEQRQSTMDGWLKKLRRDSNVRIY